MQANMGTLDRIIRVVLAAVAALLVATGQVTGVVAIVLGVLAAVLALTSAIGFCPLYRSFGLSTRPKSAR